MLKGVEESKHFLPNSTFFLSYVSLNLMKLFRCMDLYTLKVLERNNMEQKSVAVPCNHKKL